MRNRLQVVLSVAVLVLAGVWVGSAQTQTSAPATASPAKVAFINPIAVLSATAEGKQEFAKLQELTNKRQQELANLGTELRKLQEQYSQTSLTVNPQTRAEMERSIQEKELKLKRMQEDAQLEVQQQQDDLLGKMGDKLQTIINEYAQKNGIDTIFRLDQGQVFAYVNPALVVTDQIIKQYDQKHPVTAPK